MTGIGDLENIYEKKLNYENEKYLKLEQELMEIKETNKLKVNQIDGENNA